MDDDFVPIKGFENYFISRDARILKKNKRPGIARQYTTTYGYKTAFVAGKARLVHRLVAETFLPNPENKPTVNHINGVKSDNRIENLEWATYRENMQHAYDTGLKNPKANAGTANGRAKINASAALKIKKLKGLYTQTELANKFGIDRTTVSDIQRGKRWKHLQLEAAS